MLKLSGDLLEFAESGHFDAIIHGANCFCVMGAGIARQIRDRYPTAYLADCQTVRGDQSKLGTYSYAFIEQFNFVVINAYNQYSTNTWTNFQDLFDYTAFERALASIADNFKGYRFGLPLIGAGLAGGDPARIIAIIEQFALRVEQHNGSVTLVVREF